jgi:hypothetical protein
MYYDKYILESDNRVKAIWKIVKDETGKHSTVDENLSIKINSNVTNTPKLGWLSSGL